MGLGNGEGSRESLKGALKMVLSRVRYAVSSFFIHNSTQIHHAARVADLNFFTQLINIIVLDPFVCYSRKTFLTEDLIRLDTQIHQMVFSPFQIQQKQMKVK